MLYQLFEFLNSKYDFAGSGLFQYISFRAGMAVVLSILISVIFGQYLIKHFKNYKWESLSEILGLRVKWRKKVHQQWEALS